MLEDSAMAYFAKVRPSLEQALNEACDELFERSPPLNAADAVKLAGSLLQCPRMNGFAKAAAEANAKIKRDGSAAKTDGVSAHDPDDAFEWSAKSWLKQQHGVVTTLEQALLAPVKLGSDGTVPSVAQQMYLGSLGQLDSVAGPAAFLELLHDGMVLEKLANALWQGAHRLDSSQVAPTADGGARTASPAYAKFVEDQDTFEYSYGGTTMFLRGLEALIGPPNPDVLTAMTNEHINRADSHTTFETINYGIMSCPAIEWHFVYAPLEYEANTETGLVVEMARMEQQHDEECAAKNVPPRPHSKSSGFEHQWPFESALLSCDAVSLKELGRTPQPLKIFVQLLQTEYNPRIRAAGGEEVIDAEIVAARLYTG
jgi:hypothetical protein